MEIVTKKFKNKKTGEVSSEIPLFEINDWEEIREEKNIKPNKKLPNKVKLYGEMWMRNNGDIIYVHNGVEGEPVRFNLQEHLPNHFNKIVETYGTNKGKIVRENVFYKVATIFERNL